MKENFTLFLSILLVYVAVMVIRMLFTRVPVISVIVFVVALLFLMILKLGVFRISLDIIDGKKASFNDLISQIDRFPDFLIGTVLYILIVIGGLILLIVPGIVWAIKYQYYGYLIVDKKLSPFDAIKQSGKITMGHKWHLFLFWLAVIGINIVGFLALIVGLFTTIPTSIVANAYIFRTLSGKQPVSATKNSAKKKKQ